MPRYLDERAVQVVEGGVDETTALLAERFDHILYTGGGAVGRIVMRAAAEHLTPVTLELGGKSPAIVAADADVDVAAHRIAWGRFINAGQTCVAPDYVLVHEARRGPVPRRRAAPRSTTSTATTRRVVGLRTDRQRPPLRPPAPGCSTPAATRRSSRGRRRRRDALHRPDRARRVEPDAAVMQEEIFGPILPVIAVTDVDEAVGFVNERPQPLALYVFTSDDAAAERIVERTTSGGVTVNHTMLHVAVPDLPFGGVGASGIGAYHGKAGFDTFSHRRSVFTKPARPDGRCCTRRTSGGRKPSCAACCEQTSAPSDRRPQQAQRVHFGRQNARRRWASGIAAGSARPARRRISVAATRRSSAMATVTGSRRPSTVP